MTEAVNALEKELVKTKTQLDISESGVKDDVKRVAEAHKNVKEVRRLSAIELVVHLVSRLTGTA